MFHELETPLSSWRRRRPDGPRRRRPKIHLEVGHLEPRGLFTVSNGIVEYATTAGTSNSVGAVPGADRNLWVTEYANSDLVAFRPDGLIAKTVPVSGNPYGITSDAAGNLRVTVDGSNPTVDEISTGGSLLAHYALTSGALPQGITAAPSGAIWFAQYGVNALGEIVPGGSSSVTSISLGKGTRPEDLVPGSDGNLWVTDSGTNQVARVGLNGVGITSFGIPTSLSVPW